MNATNEQRLHSVIRELGPIAVAVSGGVDSMTLAVTAHRLLKDTNHAPPLMMHAVSPAVPTAATARVRGYAEREGWHIDVISAGEFDDPDYMANPANRCFFCKTNLYSTMAARTTRQLVSGTNVDDLGDYRPGLKAAAAHDVRHPYVEAGLDKSAVRAVARSLGLDDVAELPSAPCLSSRIETGIRINADVLTAIDATEQSLRDTLDPDTVRCRVRGDAIAIELDDHALEKLDQHSRNDLQNMVQQLFAATKVDKPIVFDRYRRGSAFLVETVK